MKYYAQMNVTGIGLDITDIERFRKVAAGKKDRFIASTFSEREREYCNSFSDPAPHFAGLFAAKEAVQKASGRMTSHLSTIEIRHKESGAPEVWLDEKLSTSLFVSISHSEASACAVALSAV